MTLYIYSSHLGGIYTTEYPLSDEETYCESCGDWDMELGFITNRAEAKKNLKRLQLIFRRNYQRDFGRIFWRKAGERMRLIDADALIVEWNKLAKRMAKDRDGKIPVDFGLVICEISKIPSVDAVEVVRCKDCKWFDRDLGYGKHDCKKYEMPYCLETDFCSYGERQESE